MRKISKIVCINLIFAICGLAAACDGMRSDGKHVQQGSFVNESDAQSNDISSESMTDAENSKAVETDVRTELSSEQRAEIENRLRDIKMPGFLLGDCDAKNADRSRITGIGDDCEVTDGFVNKDGIYTITLQKKGDKTSEYYCPPLIINLRKKADEYEVISLENDLKTNAAAQWCYEIAHPVHGIVRLYTYFPPREGTDITFIVADKNDRILSVISKNNGNYINDRFVGIEGMEFTDYNSDGLMDYIVVEKYQTSDSERKEAYIYKASNDSFTYERLSEEAVKIAEDTNISNVADAVRTLYNCDNSWKKAYLDNLNDNVSLYADKCFVMKNLFLEDCPLIYAAGFSGSELIYMQDNECYSEHIDGYHFIYDMYKGIIVADMSKDYDDKEATRLLTDSVYRLSDGNFEKLGEGAALFSIEKESEGLYNQKAEYFWNKEEVSHEVYTETYNSLLYNCDLATGFLQDEVISLDELRSVLNEEVSPIFN